MAITYKNRDTFISVVAWVLILYGLSSGYASLTDLVPRVWLFPLDDFDLPPFMVASWAFGLLFSIAAVWCGVGLQKRRRSRLRALVFILWLYVLWRVSQNIGTYLILDWGSAFETGLSDRMKFTLALNITTSIRVVLESALIIWVIGQFSKPMIREEFEA
jgi:hypothetical protein